jgi:type VI secretion system secreted protein Hcp
MYLQDDVCDAKVRRVILACILIGLFGMYVAPCHAQIMAVIKVEGIKGNSGIRGYEDAIRIDGWQWGINRAADSRLAMGAASGAPQIRDLVISHQLDMASPALAKACVNGAVFPKTSLLILDNSNSGNSVILAVELKEVTITSFEMTQAGSEVPHETIGMRFTEFRYTTQVGGRVSGQFSYSVKENVVR